MRKTFTFQVPWVVASKKNQHACFLGRVVLKSAAKRETQAIRDIARAALAREAGGIDEQEYDQFVRDAVHYRNGNIGPKAWGRRCEHLDAYSLEWRKVPVRAEVEFFREAGGAATEGYTKVTLTLLDWDIAGDVRKMVDIDGGATTVLDALATVTYVNDRQVEELIVRRYRIDTLVEHGTAPVTRQSPG